MTHPQQSSLDERLVGIGPLSHSLSRTSSQPVVFRPKLLDKRLNDRTGGINVFANGDSQQKHVDDLDIIKQIIIEDESLHMAGEKGIIDSGDGEGGSDSGYLRSQSFSHIPSQFTCANSMPSIPQAETNVQIKENFHSSPNVSQLRKSGLKGIPGDLSDPTNLSMEYEGSNDLGQRPQGDMCGDLLSCGTRSYDNGGKECNDGVRLLTMPGSWKQADDQKLESLLEGHTSPSTFRVRGDPRGRPSFDFGHQQQPHHLLEQQRHNYGRGGGVRRGSGVNVGRGTTMTRSASVSAGCNLSNSSSLIRGHSLSVSNPNVAPEVSSVINHYPSDSNLNSHPTLLSTPPVNTVDLLLDASSGGQNLGGGGVSEDVSYSMLGGYLGKCDVGPSNQDEVGRSLQCDLSGGIDSKNGILEYGLDMLPNNLKGK